MEGLMLVGLLGDLLPLPTIKENKAKVDFEWMRIECISFRYISNNQSSKHTKKKYKPPASPREILPSDDWCDKLPLLNLRVCLTEPLLFGGGAGMMLWIKFCVWFV